MEPSTQSDRLFEALPEAQRRQFPNVPEVVTRLQADALESTNGHRLQAMAALENLQVLEQTQRLLHTNVQEALALEVGLLKLKL